MIDCKQITLAAAQEEQYDFAYRVKKEAQGPYITAIWGWDEAKQRRFFDSDWQEHPPMIISYAGEPIGTLSVHRDKDSIEIRQFFIRPPYQRQGIGTFLLRRLLAEADASDRIAKMAFLKGSPVESLYRRSGFHTVEQSETHCHMERPPSRTGQQSGRGDAEDRAPHP